MKKLAILSICVVLLLALFAGAASANLIVKSAIDETHPLFGDSNQKASMPDHDDEDEHNIHDTGSVSIENNGTSAVNITSISVVTRTTSRDKTFTENELNISLQNSIIIEAGNTASVALKARIPEGLDAIDSNLNAVAFYVADIKLKDNSGTEVATIPAYMQRENLLEFDKVKLIIGSDESSIDDGDEIEDLKPGDSGQITVTAENKYDEDDEIEIKDAEFRIDLEGREIDLDDDEADLGDLDAEETSDEESIDFDVETDADKGTYDAKIELDGKDDYDAWHGEKMEASFKVEKEKHEIQIDSISAVPSKVTCGETVSFRIDLTNIGRNDEDEVTVRITETDLNIDALEKVNVDMDEGEETTKRIDIKIPENITSGSKTLTVIASYDFNKESDRDTYTIDVKCSPQSNDAGDDSETNSDDTDNGDTQSDSTQSQDTSSIVASGTTTAQTTSSSSTAPVPVTTVRSSGGFRDSSVYIILLILAIIIAVVAGAAIVAKIIISK